MSVITGQNGFLSGALLIGGLRLIGTRPWLGGLLLGLLTYKPQFGLLVPVALLAAGAWRGIGATVCVTLLLVALTTVMFGGSIWLDWLASLPGYSAWFAAKTELLPLKPTVLANLALLGVPEAAAELLQLLVGGAMAALVWFAFRRGVSSPAIGVLAAAAVLANPHAFWYDLPPLTAAVLFLGMARLRAGRPLRWWETFLMMLTLCLPAAMVWTSVLGPGLPISLPILLAFAVWAAWQVRLKVVGPEQPRTLGLYASPIQAGAAHRPLQPATTSAELTVRLDASADRAGLRPLPASVPLMQSAHCTITKQCAAIDAVRSWRAASSSRKQTRATLSGV